MGNNNTQFEMGSDDDPDTTIDGDPINWSDSVFKEDPDKLIQNNKASWVEQNKKSVHLMMSYGALLDEFEPIEKRLELLRNEFTYKLADAIADHTITKDDIANLLDYIIKTSIKSESGEIRIELLTDYLSWSTKDLIRYALQTRKETEDPGTTEQLELDKEQGLGFTSVMADDPQDFSFGGRIGTINSVPPTLYGRSKNFSQAPSVATDTRSPTRWWELHFGQIRGDTPRGSVYDYGAGYGQSPSSS